jgi:hypothetical protein
MNLNKSLFVFLSVPFLLRFLFAAEKPKLTLDEFFNAVSFSRVQISP